MNEFTRLRIKSVARNNSNSEPERLGIVNKIGMCKTKKSVLAIREELYIFDDSS